MQLEIGQKVGRYEVRQAPRHGGITSIYPAIDTELDRMVVLKFDSGSLRKSLVSLEARLVASLRHPNVIKVHDVGVLSGYPYAVYDYFHRSFESEVQAATSGLPVERILQIFSKVSDCVDFLHRRGIIHRGLCPRAILIDDDGSPVLGGFLLAVRSLQNELPNEHGVPAYMAPEQATGEVITPSTDVWSLGVCLYEALTGQLPFGTFPQSVERILPNSELPTPLRESLSSSLIEIALRCLRREPRERSASAAIVATELRTWHLKRPERRSTRVFISHSTQDREIIERDLILPLESAGIKTWMAESDVRKASEWEQTIKVGLETCEWFIVVVSMSALRSEWVKDELFWAIDNRPYRIVPICLDSSDPQQLHIRLRRIQHLRLSDGVEALVELLIGTDN